MHNLHVGIIMDGNGRWAQRRGLPRTAGHIEGAKTVNEVVETAARMRVRALSLYAFSADNWRRPGAEVSALMRLLRRYLMTETRRCIEQSIRINFIGRRDRLSASLVRSIEQSEQLTAGCRGMLLRVAVDYSAQHSILEAARLVGAQATLDSARFQEALDEVDHSAAPAGALDLLIRTGGERRLSDFLLWQCAYSELYFAECMWPEFGAAGFRAALDYYHGRQRRFGAVIAQGG
jgi:undecaprenyl diphosphate synthase